MKLKFNFLKAALLALSLFVFSISVIAQNISDIGAMQSSVIRQELAKIYPKLHIQSISKTPVSGIYEVIVTFPARNIIYITADAKYLFSGDLVDLKNKVSLTEQKKNELNKVSFNLLPLQNSIKEVHGNGKRKLILFSDPDCPFCKMIEQELPKLKNVTIYTFLFPLVELHPKAENRASQIWCSNNRLKTWNDFMRKGKRLPANMKCKTPIKENVAIGENLGFSGTPTLIFPNGRVVSGAIRAKEMDKILGK